MAISKREAAIRRRRKFLILSSISVLLVIAVAIIGINALINVFSKPDDTQQNNSRIGRAHV